MGYIGKVKVAGQRHSVASSLYGICRTSAEVPEKAVECVDLDSLIEGTTIYVKFLYGNTSANPTININSLGALPMYRYGAVPPGVTISSSWQVGSVISLTYDGNAWIMDGWLNDNTTYQNLNPAMGGTEESLVTTGDKYEWDHKTSNVGTVTKVTAGLGLTGGDIEFSGEIGLNLKYKNEAEQNVTEPTNVADREYPVTLDHSGYLGVNVPWEENTTYSFEDGTNGFKVIGTDGYEKTVNVTPSIQNNVTGAGTPGSLAQFDDYNNIISGPAFGDDTQKFLRNDGVWESLPGGGTVKEIDTGEGIVGGPINYDGVISLDPTYFQECTEEDIADVFVIE